MKKKVLLVLPICLLACGCFTNNKKLKCTIEEKYDDIDTKTTITTKFKKGKAISSSGEAIMTFENEEAAQAYLDAFEGTDEEKKNMKIDGKKLIVTIEEDFKEEDTKTRNEVLIYFENSGYTCK